MSAQCLKALVMKSTMSISPRLAWFSSLLLFVLFIAPTSMASSAPDVAKVTSHLKRAEANLQLVDGSIGHLTSPPKGSAGKLAKMRLDQAAGDITAAKTLLSGLSSGAGLAETKTRYASAEKLRAKLAGILTGSTPAPKPTPAPQPDPNGVQPPKPKAVASKTVRLGYPHADNFKGTLFTLRRVEADTAAMLKLHGELKPVQDQLSINHRTTAKALGTITETGRQAGFVETGLAKIPANGEGVAEAVQRLAQARTSLANASAYFTPLNAKLMDMTNPANYPEFHADVKRLRELSGMYGNPSIIFEHQRVQAAEAFTQRQAAKEECLRIARVYTRLMEQQTEQGNQIEGAGNNFLSREKEFLAAADREKATLPASIRKDLAEANQHAEEAVRDQKPMWFRGGIPQRLDWADEKLALYTVLDPQGSVAIASEVTSMKASIKTRADSLRELIIRENTLPNNNFEGGDRDAAIAMAIDAWKKQEPEFELLTVCIPSKAWARETKWSYSNGTWYFIDKSSIQVRLIIADKSNPELAIDRAVNVRKDHQKADALYGVPLRSIKEELGPSEYLLRSKVK
ncbi:MAG: hypothetical protein ACI841_000987 [Planctomycetota bacterium]|jgi:hypothetical protein